MGSTRKDLPDADSKIVFDKFHILQHLGHAVDLVRRAEDRQLRAEGDERLIKTRYLWLTHPDRLEGEARARIDSLRKGTLRTARAFRYKEHASRLWGYVRRGMAERVWRERLHGSLRCRLVPIRVVARLIYKHSCGVINPLSSHVTNHRSDSLNSRIQPINTLACAFR